jgi:hypothetical protein
VLFSLLREICFGQKLLQTGIYLGLVFRVQIHFHCLKETRINLIGVWLLFFKHFEKHVLLLGAAFELFDLLYLA